MTSLLLNFFDDWGVAIYNGLGRTWVLILAIIFACLALFMLQSLFVSMLKHSIRKNKFIFKFFQFLFMVIFVFFAVWFLTLL